MPPCPAKDNDCIVVKVLNLTERASRLTRGRGPNSNTVVEVISLSCSSKAEDLSWGFRGSGDSAAPLVLSYSSIVDKSLMLNTIAVGVVAGSAELAGLHADAAAEEAASPVLPFRAVEGTAAGDRLDTRDRIIEDSIAQVTAA